VTKTITESYKYVVAGRSKRTDEVNGVKTVVFDSNVPYTTYSVQGFRTTGDGYRDWRKRLITGQYCNTLLSAQKTRVKIQAGHAFRTIKVLPSTPANPIRYITNERTGCLTWHIAVAQFNSALITPSDNLAKMGFVKKLLKAQRQVSATVSLGELGETLRMLKSPAKKLREGIRDYTIAQRRRSQRRYRGRWYNERQNRILRDTWLEYQFGWRPLISDIENARKAIAKIGEYKPFKIVSFEAGRESSAQTRHQDSTNGSVRIDYEKENFSQCTTKYKGCVSIDTDPLGFRSASQNFGFDWQEFVPTVWELIPYSFLVDYFSNIGEILSALSVNTSRVRWMDKTIRQTRRSRLYGHTLAPATLGANDRLEHEGIWPGSYEFSEVIVTRNLYTGSLVPDLQVEIPGIGSLKWLNIAALRGYRRLNHKRLRI